MALTKAGIIQHISEEIGLPKHKSSHVVERLLEIMKDALAAGEDVLISGFGKFCVREKSERLGRNPATGDALMLPARRVVTFKCSGKLRDRCDGQCGAKGND